MGGFELAIIGSETIWRISGEGRLPWRCWDGDYIVFNPLSGKTHLLDIVAGEILVRVLALPRPMHVLCAMVAEFLEIENDAALAAKVSAILAELDHLGLIEPVPEC